MIKGKCIWALALLVLLTGACASDDDAALPAATVDTNAAASGGGDTILHVDPAIRRQRALEAQARKIADEKVWGGRFSGPGTVTRAWARGRHLLFETRAAETREYSVHCVDIVKGRQKWVLVLGENALSRAPHVGHGTIAFLTELDSGMIVVNAHTGSRIWHKRAKLGVVPCSDAMTNMGTVYVASYLSERMVAASAADGRKVWDFRTKGACRTVPVLTRDMARQLLIYGTDAGELVALEAKEVSEVAPTSTKWTKPLNGSVSGNPKFAMVGASDAPVPLVVVPCDDGWLYGVDPATGRSRWVLRTDSAFQTEPMVTGNRVFARNGNRMFCLDAVSGERVWFPKEDMKLSEYEREQIYRRTQGYEHANRALAANDDRAYLLLGPNTVMRCNAQDGSVANEQTLPAFDFFVSNEASDTLILGTSDGYFLAFK